MRCFLRVCFNQTQRLLRNADCATNEAHGIQFQIHTEGIIGDGTGAGIMLVARAIEAVPEDDELAWHEIRVGAARRQRRMGQHL